MEEEKEEDTQKRAEHILVSLILLIASTHAQKQGAHELLKVSFFILSQ